MLRPYKVNGQVQSQNRKPESKATQKNESHHPFGMMALKLCGAV
jgi:hypothetical protein